MFPIYLKNFRRGLATNSSSTHSVIYRNDGEVFNDMNIFTHIKVMGNLLLNDLDIGSVINGMYLCF